MKQLGNLAIVCARRQDIVLLICRGEARVCVGGSGGDVLVVKWDDDAGISEVIKELNFGKFSEKKGRVKGGTNRIFEAD